MNISTHLRVRLLSQQKWNITNWCQIHVCAKLHLWKAIKYTGDKRCTLAHLLPKADRITICLSLSLLLSHRYTRTHTHTNTHTHTHTHTTHTHNTHTHPQIALSGRSFLGTVGHSTVSHREFQGTIPIHSIWEGAVKSLARSGRKQATATKLGIFNILPTKLNTLFSPLL